MNVKVKRAMLWTTDKPNTPGTLASTLGPLADHRVNLDLLMGYSTSDKTHATVEVYPVEGESARRAARQAGFTRSGFPCVSVCGKNQPGLGRHIAAALSDAGININFFIAQVVGSQYAGMFSFEAESEADLAVRIIRQAVSGFTGKTQSATVNRGGRRQVATVSATKKSGVKRRAGRSR